MRTSGARTSASVKTDHGQDEWSGEQNQASGGGAKCGAARECARGVQERRTTTTNGDCLRCRRRAAQLAGQIKAVPLRAAGRGQNGALMVPGNSGSKGAGVWRKTVAAAAAAADVARRRKRRLNGVRLVMLRMRPGRVCRALAIDSNCAARAGQCSGAHCCGAVQKITGRGADGRCGSCGESASERPMIDCTTTTNDCTTRAVTLAGVGRDKSSRRALLLARGRSSSSSSNNNNNNNNRQETCARARRRCTISITASAANNNTSFGRLFAVACACLALVIGCAGALGQRQQQQQQQPPQPNTAGKAQLWRQLVGVPLELNGGASRDAAELLARSMAKWPDQQKAALFYLDLLAGHKLNCARQVSLAELAASDAELLAHVNGNSSARISKKKNELNTRIERIRPESPLAKQLNSGRTQTGQLAQLALDNANLISRLLVTSGPEQEHQHDDDDDEQQQRNQATLRQRTSGGGSIFSRIFARIGGGGGADKTAERDQLGASEFEYANDEYYAQDSAHNSSQSAAGRALLVQLAKPKFFKYLLESRVRARLAEPGGSRALHALGLAFVGGSMSSSSSSSSSSSPDDEQISSKLIPFAPIAIVRHNKPSKWAGRGGSTKRPIVELTRLILSSKNSSSFDQYQDNNDGQQVLPSYLARWLQENKLDKLLNEQQTDEMTPPSRTNGDDTRPAYNIEQRVQQLTLANGDWFSPHLDCGRSNRWLLTYSVPFFHTVPHNSPMSNQDAPATKAARLKLRGVSFVQIDFAQTNLFNQCDDGDDDGTGYKNKDHAPGAWFWSGTHECARIASSQCIPLQRLANDKQRRRQQANQRNGPSITEVEEAEEGEEDGNNNDDEQMGALRSGAYVCACPSWAPRVPSQLRRAYASARQQLADSLLERTASSVTLGLVHQITSEHQQWASEQASPAERHRLADRLQTMRYRYISNSSRQQQTPMTTDDNTTTNGLAQNSSPATYFALGGQLESDAMLELTIGSISSDSNANDERAQTRPSACSLCTSNNNDDAHGTLLSAGTAAGQCQHYKQITSRPQSTSHNGNLIRPIIMSMQLICILLILALIAIVLRIRKSSIMIASGWLMLETMLIGALLLYTSVLVKSFQATSLTCLLEPWLHELGFSIFYGSILIKLYRILTEFQTRKAHRVCLRDKDQAIYLLAIILIVIGYMSAWTALMVDGFFVGYTSNNFDAQLADYVGPMNNKSNNMTINEQTLSIESRILRRDLSSIGSTYQHLSVLEAANDQLKLLAHGLNSFGKLFLGLLETEHYFDAQHDELVYFVRCRKLTWDYVTESSELALLVFGLHLIYKLRNASSEVHKEKLILCLSIAFELASSLVLYGLRHALWNKLTGNSGHLLLLLYALRCQLTVTLTVALVFVPKLNEIVKSKPRLIFGPLLPSSTGISSSGSATGTQTGTTGQRSGAGGSVRHRCHISCEIHDHHLNDATRLHQAMLSNSALEIGSINLADMDPDEIQAELKRVYTQLEVLKTKVMRRDNPHISKRRGGRKPGHRKFSLQAFHARHSSSTDQQQQQQQQQHRMATEHQASFDGASGQVQGSLGIGLAEQAGRLPALAEGSETPPSSSVCAESWPLHGAGGSGSTKHVKVSDLEPETDDELAANRSYNSATMVVTDIDCQTSGGQQAQLANRSADVTRLCAQSTQSGKSVTNVKSNLAVDMFDHDSATATSNVATRQHHDTKIDRGRTDEQCSTTSIDALSVR